MLKYFQSRKLKRLFSQYVPITLVEEVMNNDESEEYLDLKQYDVYFILIKTHEIVQNERTPVLSSIINKSTEHGALVEHLMGSIVLLSYGLLNNKIDYEKKDKLINEIVSENPNNVAIVHGLQYTYAGNVGNNIRCSYGTILNNISTILTELGKLNFGDIKEIPKA